jgi:hypothetical protein
MLRREKRSGKHAVAFSVDRLRILTTIDSSEKHLVMVGAQVAGCNVTLGLFLGVLVRQCTAVLQLLASENETLLTLLILDLGLEKHKRVGSTVVDRRNQHTRRTHTQTHTQTHTRAQLVFKANNLNSSSCSKTS